MQYLAGQATLIQRDADGSIAHTPLPLPSTSPRDPLVMIVSPDDDVNNDTRYSILTLSPLPEFCLDDAIKHSQDLLANSRLKPMLIMHQASRDWGWRLRLRLLETEPEG